MMRAAFVFFPLLLAAGVLAQPAATPAELVKKLGDQEYAVREQATQALIKLGDEAIPALEKALKSDDVEVRLRAGRALRAIRGKHESGKEQRERVEPGEPGAQPGRSTLRSVQIQVLDGKVKVTVQETIDGKQTTKIYEGESLDEIKKQHPELAKSLGGFHFSTRRSRDPFDMDKFWNDWGKDFNDDFMRRWQENSKRDLQRMQRWWKMLEEQRRALGASPLAPRPAPAASVLGVRASRPPAVLDAQLQLRGVGLVIDAVEKETRADRLGLKRYDILLKLNGSEIRRAEDVARILRDVKEGAPLSATVVRHGEVKRLSTGR